MSTKRGSPGKSPSPKGPMTQPDSGRGQGSPKSPKGKPKGAFVQPPAPKREEFHRYLERTGVIEALTGALMNLYDEPEKPKSSIDYFLDRLSPVDQMQEELKTLQNEMLDLEAQLGDLESENAEMKGKLRMFELKDELEGEGHE